MKSKQAQLDQLAQQIMADASFAELAEQATQLVMGEGSLDTDVVFIGEAPGKREDAAGRPFIGASGKLLDTMLDSIGLSREQIYITNIVKYRPPNNRDPKPVEKANFWPYLLQQLDVIQPKLVVTLGRHSLEMFLPGTVIADMHGQLGEVTIENRHYQLLPLYHPALGLYNGSKRPLLLSDFQQIVRALEWSSVD